MSRIKFLLLSLFLMAGIGQLQAEPTYPSGLVQLHKNVWQELLMGNTDIQAVKNLMKDLNDKGEWSSIDYTSKQRGSWPTAEHLSKVASMARAYQRPGTELYHNQDLKAKIMLSLNYWLNTDLINPNWWYPEIGIPQSLIPTLILMEEELSGEQMAKGIKIMNRSKIGMTGQNKVWLSGNVLLKSLLLRDAEMISKASASIQEELKVSLNEGIQPDGSFHQHGPQIQFGNYGLSYVGDMIKWVRMLRSTPYQFDESKIFILRNYLLEGQQWIVWKNQMDISACGRQLFVNAQMSKARSLASMISQMESLDPANASLYKAANQYGTLSGNKHFWRSDFQVQRNPDYYFSVKMCSERVIGAESCNSENISGYYMGDGASYLFQSGKEYENIFPYWDWKKVPGTTTHQDNKVLPVLTASGYRLPSNFVGGVSDGKSGIAAMDYVRGGLTAHKAWFIFGNQIVCLGAGITSQAGLAVTTSVNQAYLNGETLMKAGSLKSVPQETSEAVHPAWILQNRTGYFFPQGGNLQLETRTVDGSWNRVALMYKDEIIKSPIFKLWFDHGTNPQDQKYAYILIPGANIALMQKLEKTPSFTILKNEKDLQAVISADKTLGGAIFYQPGSADLFGGVQALDPCIVMMKKVKEGIQVSVSDPTQKLKQISLSFKGKYSADSGELKTNDGRTGVTFSLPSGDEAGKTVTMILKKQ